MSETYFDLVERRLLEQQAEIERLRAIVAVAVEWRITPHRHGDRAGFAADLALAQAIDAVLDPA